jgi:hypothetical protein
VRGSGTDDGIDSDDVPIMPKLTKQERAEASVAAAKRNKMTTKKPTRGVYLMRQFAAMTRDTKSFLFCMQKLLLVANDHICARCGQACTLAMRERSDKREDQYLWVCQCDLQNKYG